MAYQLSSLSKQSNETILQNYYTPKTYGIEGLKFNGFDVDQIFVAGSNVIQDGKIPFTTWGMLRFHVSRSLLSAVHGLMEKRYLGVEKKSPMVLRNLDVSEVTNLADLDKVVPTADADLAVATAPSSLMVVLMYIYSVISATFFYFLFFCSSTGFLKDTLHSLPLFHPKDPSKRTVFMNSPTKATNVTVVLSSHPYVAPPPPFLPEEVTSSFESTHTFDAEEIAAAKLEISKYEIAKNNHEVSDYKRLLADASDLVYYASVSSLRRLTIYEETGVLNQNPELLAKSVKKKVELVGVGSTVTVPEIVFVFVSQQLKVALSNGRITISSLSAPSSTFGEDENVADKTNKPLEVVILEKRNGKRFAATVCRQLCSFVKKGLLTMDNFENSIERAFEEAYITPAADLVITSGLSCQLHGLSPLNVDGSTF